MSDHLVIKAEGDEDAISTAIERFTRLSHIANGESGGQECSRRSDGKDSGDGIGRRKG